MACLQLGIRDQHLEYHQYLCSTKRRCPIDTTVLINRCSVCIDREEEGKTRIETETLAKGIEVTEGATTYTAEVQKVEKSKRVVKKPTYLKDFV